MRFSQRIGVTPTSKEIQKESIDSELRNGLWNILYNLVLTQISENHSYQFDKKPLEYFRLALYHHFFKVPLDEAPKYKDDIIRSIKNFFFNAKWYEVYDLIEFTITEVKADFYEIENKDVVSIFNSILEREFAAYRMINVSFSPIVNEAEINEIKNADQQTASFSALKGCNIHLSRALNLLSDRKNPDYRNSIKESISAIESLVKIISQNPKDTLGGAIDKIKGKIRIHQSLEKGFKQIYGYTSDSDGIRHALMEESTCDFDDAKYMLVSCSAFINYLIAKAIKAGINLN